MKNSKRNLIILCLMLGAVFYGTFLVIGSTAVPIYESDEGGVSLNYMFSLQERLYELVAKEAFSEAEIVFRRVSKLDPENRNILRLGSLICFRNGRLNESENMLRNLLLRNPGDYVCRNNYGVVLMARKRVAAVRELEKAWYDSGKKEYIRKNLQLCAAAFNIRLSDSGFSDAGSGEESAPLDAIVLQKEKE